MAAGTATDLSIGVDQLEDPLQKKDTKENEGKDLSSEIHS